MKKSHIHYVSSTAWRSFINFPALLASLLILLFSLPAAASYQDITGVWFGKLSGSDFSCSPPTLDGPFSSKVTVTFSNQVNGNFDVTAVDVDNADGFTETSTGSGFFLGPNQIEFTLSNSSGGESNGSTVNADISGSKMSFSFSGSNFGGDYCNWSGSGSVTRSGGDQTQLVPAVEAGSTVTGVALQNTQVNTFNNSLGAHLVSALRGNGPQGLAMNTNGLGYEYKTGLNAGGDNTSYGIWGNYSYSDFDNDLSSTAYDGKAHNLLGGIDYAPIKDSVLGISFGYSYTDVDTTFNRGNQENDTYTIAPYFGLLINDTWSLDANIGFSRVNIDQYRVAPGANTRITSSPSVDRWFGSINLNGVTYFNNWIIGGRVGTLRAKDTQDSFVESNGVAVPEISNTLGTLSIGTDVAYSFGKYEPFASLTYEYDYRFTRIGVAAGAQPANDSDDFLFGLGVRYYGSKGLSGNLEWNRRLGRSNIDEDVFSFSLRADF